MHWKPIGDRRSGSTLGAVVIGSLQIKPALKTQAKLDALLVNFVATPVSHARPDAQGEEDEPHRDANDGAFARHAGPERSAGEFAFGIVISKTEDRSLGCGIETLIGLNPPVPVVILNEIRIPQPTVCSLNPGVLKMGLLTQKYQSPILREQSISQTAALVTNHIARDHPSRAKDKRRSE